MSKPTVILIGPSGNGFSTAHMVAQVLAAKELGTELVTVKVGGQEKEDKIVNVERALSSDLQQYIELNFKTRGKIFKTGGNSELMLVDDIQGGEIHYKKKRNGRFGGTNFTPKKKKRK